MNTQSLAQLKLKNFFFGGGGELLGRYSSLEIFNKKNNYLYCKNRIELVVNSDY